VLCSKLDFCHASARNEPQNVMLHWVRGEFMVCERSARVQGWMRICSWRSCYLHEAVQSVLQLQALSHSSGASHTSSSLLQAERQKVVQEPDYRTGCVAGVNRSLSHCTLSSTCHLPVCFPSHLYVFLLTGAFFTSVLLKGWKESVPIKNPFGEEFSACHLRIPAWYDTLVVRALGNVWKGAEP
jgi:hypothetical protein